MYGFRSLTENRLLMGIGLVVLVAVMGIGTYVMMYQPSAGLSVHVGSAPKSPGGEVTGSATSTATPTASPTSDRGTPLPSRGSVSIKVQSSGGTQPQVDDMLRRAQQLGYTAMPAEVGGKTVNGVVIRYKPGMSATALRVSSELAPSATLEEHSDISVDIVIAVGKS